MIEIIEVKRYVIWAIGILFFAIADLFWMLFDVSHYNNTMWFNVGVTFFGFTITMMVVALLYELYNYYKWAKGRP